MTGIGAIDLFCGAGGLTRGLLDAGIDVVAGIDIDPASRYPYEHNNGVSFHQVDIRDVNGDFLRKIWTDSPIRLLAGCAPCQPFSTYGSTRRTPEHKDWDLLREFARLIDETRPELVTMENVPGIEKQPVFDEFMASLSAYSVWHNVVSLDSIGVPQTRKRLVVLASRVGPDISFSPPPARMTVRDAIGNLGDHVQQDRLHIWPTLSPINQERIRHSVPGGSWRDWPEALRVPCHTRGSGHTYPSVYGRMRWDAPGPTITTQCFAYGSGRFGHPEANRAISLREAALLQTFPPDYSFVDPEEPLYIKRVGRVIGNAVPPKLGLLIGRVFQQHCEAPFFASHLERIEVTNEHESPTQDDRELEHLGASRNQPLQQRPGGAL